MKFKDINTDQKTSSDRPFRPLTPLEKEGVMIAEFMGLRYETRNYFGGDFQPDENGFDTYSHNSIMVGTYYDGEERNISVPNMQYHTDWNWLMPVIKKYLIGQTEVSRSLTNTNVSEILDGLCYQDISRTYKAVVEFIKDQI